MAASCQQQPDDPTAEVDSSMSDEAFDLITCFYNGVDVMVRELAEEIAEQEGSRLPDEPNVVAIEVRHVQEAGRRVIEAFRGLLKVGRVPKDLEDAVKGMGGCFEHRMTR